MASYLQDPHHLDSNVTIKVPERIDVAYDYPKGWYIRLDGKLVGTMVSGGKDYRGDKNPDRLEVTYFRDAGDAVDWLVDRSLLKTKAYAELDKRVRKIAKKAAKA